MIIVLKPGVAKDEIEFITEKIRLLGLIPHISTGEERTIIGVIGDENKLREAPLSAMAGVESVMPIVKPYKMASRDFTGKDTIIKIKDVQIGGNVLHFFAGPCTVEDEKSTMQIAEFLQQKHIRIMRGGAFKPRTSPYAFQGLGLEGLKILRRAADAYNLIIVTEVMAMRDIDDVVKYADIIQVGARNVQNFTLLKELGSVPRPVLLKRGLATKIEEWLMSAEYIMSEGNKEVILCERGIRTFETATDPSHGVGVRQYIPQMVYAAIASGSDGILLEVHPDPDAAMVDGAQTVDFHEFTVICDSAKKVAHAINKEIACL